MKKLFLASQAVITLDKVTELLPKKPSELNLVFIPTAAELYKEKPWLDEDRGKLVQMGFKVKNLDLRNKTSQELSNDVKNVDVIFVAGGNTFYLLEKVKESGFDKVLRRLIDKGIVYIGSSAGSVLLCPTIAVVEGLDDQREAPKLKSYKGLGVIDFLILPHYGEEKYKKKHELIIEKWKNKGFELKLLTNQQAIIVNNDRTKVVES